MKTTLLDSQISNKGLPQEDKYVSLWRAKTINKNFEEVLKLQKKILEPIPILHS
jgi:hypothetical protein